MVRVTLRPGVDVDLARLRRNLYASSSCGICGKATIENALQCAPPLDDPARFDAEFFYGLPERLREAQPVFSETGGLPLGKRSPARQAYRMTELKRWKEALNLDLNVEPKHFPVPDGDAQKVVVAAIQAGHGPGKVAHRSTAPGSSRGI